MEQKIWFITGATKGFGNEITKAALHAGDKVVATVRKNKSELYSSSQFAFDPLIG
jgi:NAD(P)-dependent dehydrogenase (short-subunit alcohol dehydrogenase family)